MAVAKEWDEVEEAFARLERHGVLHPTLAAMRKLVDLVKHDVALADVHPIVSMASLLLSRGPAKRRVMVAWHEDRGYHVAFGDPPLEFSESVLVPEEEVMLVVREYLDRLGATPPP